MRAEPVGEAPSPHREDRPPGTPRLPTPRRRDDARAKAERTACGALQALRQLDVLHQRLVRIAADRVEERALDEDALIAGRDARQPRAQVHHRGDEPQDAGTPRDRHVEPAPATPRSAQIVAGWRERRWRAGANPRGGTAGRRRSPPRLPRSSVPRGRAGRQTRGRRAAPPAPSSRRRCRRRRRSPRVRPPAAAAAERASATMPRASSSAGTMTDTRIRGSGRRAQASAPPQLDPCPAVQP